MNKPKLRKINETDINTLKEIEDIIQESLSNDYIISCGLNEFTIDKLNLLCEYAKVNNIIVSLKAEHSNFYQGVMVGLVKKEIIDKFKNYI